MTDEPNVGEITPQELAALLEGEAPIVLIDVREPYEWQIGRIPTARLIPLRTLMVQGPDVDHDVDIVLYCHHGARSEAAANALVANGYRRVRNLVGGINRWSLDVDPTVRRY
jgi:adenylyltransferase/sulfurtransferase